MAPTFWIASLTGFSVIPMGLGAYFGCYANGIAGYGSSPNKAITTGIRTIGTIFFGEGYS